MSCYSSFINQGSVSQFQFYINNTKVTLKYCLHYDHNSPAQVAALGTLKKYLCWLPLLRSTSDEVNVNLFSSVSLSQAMYNTRNVRKIAQALHNIIHTYFIGMITVTGNLKSCPFVLPETSYPLTYIQSFT